MEDWRWVLLSAVAKLFYALGIKAIKEHEFGLASDDWKEAEAAASVAASRGLLASLPVLLILSSLAKADEVCHHQYDVVSLLVLLLAVLVFSWTMLTKIPAWWLRGSLTAFFLVGALTAIEGAYTLWATQPVAKLVCLAPSAVSGKHEVPVTPAVSAPSHPK